MAKRNEIVDFLNKYLRSDGVGDASRNGLQVEGKPQVRKLAFGVSASAEFLRLAAAEGADLAVVHHGLIWDSPERVAGSFKLRLKTLLDAEMSLAAWHLPLDMHEKCGNSAQLLGFFDPADIKPFGEYHGSYIGMKGRLKLPLRLHDAADILKSRIGGDPVELAFGPEAIRTVGVISGGASAMIGQAIAEKLDLYISGDASEPVYEFAREGKINFISGGHYNTEKTGVLALKEIAAKRFRIKTVFIDVPNPF